MMCRCQSINMTVVSEKDTSAHVNGNPCHTSSNLGLMISNENHAKRLTFKIEDILFSKFKFFLCVNPLNDYLCVYLPITKTLLFKYIENFTTKKGNFSDKKF